MPKTLTQIIEDILTYGREQTHLTWKDDKHNITPISKLSKELLADVRQDITEMDGDTLTSHGYVEG